MKQDLSSSSKDVAPNLVTTLPASPARSKKSALAKERAKVQALKADRAELKEAKAEKKRAKEAKKLAKEEKRLAKARKPSKQAEPPVAPFSLRARIAEQVRAANEAVLLVNSADAVHQTRIALKRLRVLSHIADEAIPQGGAGLEFAAQAAMHRLAHARDLAAVEHAARAVAKETKGPAQAFLVRAANEFALARRGAEITALSDASEALLRLTPIIEAVPEADTAVAQRAARVLVRRAKRAFQRAKGSKEVLKRHTWRKREKDRRYASMMLGDNWPGKARRKRAANVTEALGRERDAGLLLARLSANARTPSVVLRQVKRHRRALRKQADKLGARLHRKR